MKNLKRPTFSCLLLMIFLWSCSDSFLDSSLTDGSITDASAFKSKADFDAGVIGIYTSLQGGNAAGEAWIKVPGYISQDAIDVAQAPKPIGSYMSAGNDAFQGYWTELYKIVASANIVLDKLAVAPEGILTDVEKSRIEGQAKFLRGFAYFNLARAYGDLPLVLSVYNPDQNSLSCTPESEVWAQVVTDLTDASTLLPEANDWSAADKGRVTKGAALAYLANANMYLENWTEAAAATTNLLALTKPAYALAPSVRTAFSLKKTDVDYNKENIFEVQYREKADANFQWGATPNTGHLLAGLTGARDIGRPYSSWGGWGEIILNSVAVNSFEDTDERRIQLNILHGEAYAPELSPIALTDGDPVWASNKQLLSGFSTKYWLGDDGGALSPQNLPQMRFAEILLNYAEILFKQGNSASAYANLSLVRDRAGLADKPASADPVVFMADLMNERRHELLLEPNLWFHYTRTNTAEKFLLDNYGIVMLPQWRKFPIPQRERDINPNICSNGY